MKIIKYLALFVVLHNVQRAPFHLAHAVLKSMVDPDQLVIVIMAVTNHQGLEIPSLQILNSKIQPRTNSKYTMGVKLFSFILFYT